MRRRNLITNRASSSVKDPKEYTVQITDMLGVDYSHSQLFVENPRGTAILNFIKKNGITQKRNGWKEIKWYSNNELTQFKNGINGVWTLPVTYYDTTSNKYVNNKYLIVQSGVKFYSKMFTESDNDNILDDNNHFTFTEISFTNSYEGNTNYKNKIKNEVSYGVMENGRLYVFCGTYIMIGTFGSNTELSIRLVQNDPTYTYTPTITYGGTFDEFNKINWGTSTEQSMLLPKTFEQVNMLMNSIKETKLGLTLSSYSAYIEHKGNISSDVEQYDFVLTYIPNTATPTLYASGFPLVNNSYIDGNNDYNLSVTHGAYTVKDVAHYYSNKTDYDNNTNNEDFYFCILYRDSLNPDTAYSSKDDLITYISTTDHITTDEASLRVEAFIRTNKLYEPLVEGEDNYVITYGIDTGADKINECKFGIVYGINNNQNRLFVSGNKNFINYDWHSSQPIDNSFSSFSYFGDLGYTKLGNEQNAIAGYEIASDGTMIVMKTPSNIEPTIYLRSAELAHPLKADGTYDTDVYIESYPVKVGSVGEGLVGLNNIHNLNGDTLIVSPNGVYGIEIDKAVSTNQRFAKNRSRLIDTVLSRYSLKDAVSCIFDNKFFLSINGMCYIADARYKSKLSDDLNEDYQYEWWVWDNVNARVFFEFNNKLMFGTSDGQLLAFDDKDYVDVAYGLFKQSEGQIHFDITDNIITLPEMLSGTIESLHENDGISIKAGKANICFKLLDASQYEIDTLSHTIHITDEDFDFEVINYFNTDKVYIDNNENQLDIVDVNIENKSFKLSYNNAIIELEDEVNIYKEASDNLKLINVQATLGSGIAVEDIETKSHIEGNIMYDEVIKDGNTYYCYDKYDNKVNLGSLVFNQFQLAEIINGKPYLLEMSDFKDVTTTDNVIFQMTFRNIVKCYFVSKTFDFGSPIYYKKVKQLTLTPDEASGTRVEFGYETSRTGQMFSAYTGKAFDFNDIDFTDISFEGSNFAKSYTNRIRDAFNFIRFIFKNETNSNCKISNLTILYTVGTKTKGVV